MDVSSYQPTDLTALIAEHQVEHVVVRLYLDCEKPSKDITRAQIASARANGCTVGGYMWLYADRDARADVREAVRLARECDAELPVLWLDVEPFTDGSIPRWTAVMDALNACFALGVSPGIYTGAWVWRAHYPDLDVFGNTDIPLWAAQYDNIPDPDVFAPFGGWTRCAGKQYTDKPVDLNVFRREVVEVDAIAGPRTEA